VTLRSTVWESWYSDWGAEGGSVLDLVLAHVRTLRPWTRLWFDTLTPLALIVVLTGWDPPWGRAWLFVAVMNLIHGAATLLNDLQDVESDRASEELLRRTRPIARGVLSRRLVWWEIAVMTGLALLLAASMGWASFALWVVVCLLIAAHELPPVRTQSRPVLAQVVGLAMAFAIFGALIAAFGVDDAGTTVPYLVFVSLYISLAGTLVKDLRDIDSDAEGGKTTTAVAYGAAKTAALAAAAYLLAAIPWLWFVLAADGVRHEWLLWVASGLLLAWGATTAGLSRRFRRVAGQAERRFVHRGAIVVLSLINLAVILAHVA
jgi:4-hydroxybenzoate polyprenyltransferase